MGRLCTFSLIAIATGACSLGALDGYSEPFPPDPDAAPLEAAIPNDAAEAATCASGTRLRVLEAKPFVHDGGGGIACNTDRVFDRDDQYGAVDMRFGTFPMTSIDGQRVGGCILVRFASGQLGSLFLRVDGVMNGCGSTCNSCSANAKMTVFAGPSAAELKFVAMISAPAPEFPFDRTVTLPADIDATFAAVCHAGDPQDRDALVDVIEGICR